MANRRRFKRARGRRAGRITAKTVAKIASRVALRKIETKSKEYVYSSVGNIPAGNFSSVGYDGSSVIGGLVAGIAAGTGDGARIGKKIFIRGVRIRYIVQGADSYNNIRFMLVSPKRGGDYSSFGGSVSGLIAGVLSNAPSGATQYAYPIDTRIFKVYMDTTMSFVPSETSAGTFTVKPKVFNRFIKINKSTYWTEGNDTTAQREFYLCAISDSAAVSHPGVIAGTVKVYYKDA